VWVGILAAWSVIFLLCFLLIRSPDEKMMNSVENDIVSPEMTIFHLTPKLLTQQLGP
jgi:hypothetical protein